jgi:hypothetical protein
MLAKIPTLDMVWRKLLLIFKNSMKILCFINSRTRLKKSSEKRKGGWKVAGYMHLKKYVGKTGDVVVYVGG